MHLNYAERIYMVGKAFQWAMPSATSLVGVSSFFRSNKAIEGFTQAETAAIQEVKGILGSKEFTKLKDAFTSGKFEEVSIGGRQILYEPGMPSNISAMTVDKGFVLGKQAFSSSAGVGVLLNDHNF